MKRRVLFSLAMVACLASVAQAAAILSIGNVVLEPNKAGQAVPVFISNDTPGATAGMNLWVLVGDGGPTNNITGPGIQVGPSVSINITAAPNLFNVNNTGQGNLDPGGDFGPQGAGASTTTGSGTIPVPAGMVRIGTLIFNTTGFLPLPVDQVWDLNLGGSNNATSAYLSDISGTSLNGLDLTVIDGSITIPGVPEPSSIVIGLFALVGLSATAIYRRRR